MKKQILTLAAATLLKALLLFVFFVSFRFSVLSQNVGINTTGATPNLSALLDISASPGFNRGFLIPRMTGAQRTAMNPLPETAQGLIVYQTDGIEGFYYNTSTTITPIWIYLVSGNSGWMLSGNAGTDPSVNFIGTTDGQDFVVRTNNSERMRVFSGGNANIGLTGESRILRVRGKVRVLEAWSDDATTNYIEMGEVPYAGGPTAGGDAIYGKVNLWLTTDEDLTLMYGPSGGHNFEIYNGTPGFGTIRLRLDNSGLLTLPSLTASSTVFTDASQRLTTTGTVGVTNGGTGTTTQFTQGSVIFAGASGVYTQDNANFFFDDVNNRLCIGTITSARRLTVTGDQQTTGFGRFMGWNSEALGTGGLAAEIGSNGTAAIMQSYNRGAATFGDISLATGASPIGITIKATTGNVGIGCTAPAYKLHVIGDIASSTFIRAPNAFVTAAIAACSDIRYKKDITPLPDALNNVMKLQGVNYYWKAEDFPEKKFTDEKQIGFIAQEIEKIYPQVVITDVDGYKSVDYSRITPVLAEAIKEQQQIINSLKMENKNLQSAIKKLETRNLKLETDYGSRIKKLEELTGIKAEK